MRVGAHNSRGGLPAIALLLTVLALALPSATSARSRSSGAGATVAAVQHLAAAAGHPLRLPAAGASAAFGRRELTPWLVFAAGWLVVAVAWAASLRARPPSLRARTGAP